jgi:hypothetical protein
MCLPESIAERQRFFSAGKKLATLPVELHVDAFILPDPEDYSFYLDLWQHPAQVADQLRLKRWSEEHWKILEVYLRELARAGQKVITATIIEAPWGGQTEFPYASWWCGRATAKNLRWDYTWFRPICATLHEGRYPTRHQCLLAGVGTGGRRDCVVAYQDGGTGERKLLTMEVGDETYRAVWTAFLVDFKKHLDAKGWLGMTQIAFDEKPADIMETAMGLVRQVAPELKIELAGNYHAEIDTGIQDYCIAYPGTDPDIARARKARGQVTTFYTCCGPAFPNTFSFSPLTEPRLLPWHAAAIGSDGYLRWAWNSWPKDPMTSPDFGPWPSGDTFLVYPGKEGPIGTLRWEAFKAGVQDFELVAAVRERLERESNTELQEALRQALELATRNPDGREKALSDLPRARAMLVRALLMEKSRVIRTNPSGKPIDSKPLAIRALASDDVSPNWRACRISLHNRISHLHPSPLRTHRERIPPGLEADRPYPRLHRDRYRRVARKECPWESGLP